MGKNLCALSSREHSKVAAAAELDAADSTLRSKNEVLILKDQYFMSLCDC